MRTRVYIYTRELLVSTVPGTVGTVTYSVARACAGETRNFCVEVCFTGLNLPDRDLATCGVFRGNRARPPAWSVCASFRPLDIHEYVFGAKSCATRLKPMGSARLSAAKGAAYVTLAEFVAIRETSVSLPFAGQNLPAASSAYRGVGLRHGIPFLVRLALRGESTEPALPVSLSSTLGFTACSSHGFFLCRESAEDTRTAEQPTGRTRADGQIQFRREGDTAPYRAGQRLSARARTVRCRANASWPKGDCGVGAYSRRRSHIAFRPLLAYRDSDLRSKTN